MKESQLQRVLQWDLDTIRKHVYNIPMQPLAKILESKMRVQYQDCDPFNHLNNAKYIDYAMAARTEQLLEQYGFNTAELAYQQGLGWVAAQTQVSYFFPASWLEMLTIESRLLQFSASSLLVEAIVWDEHKTHTKSVVWIKLVHFDIKNQKSNKHPEDMLDLFSKIHYPIANDPTFEDRVKSFKQLNTTIQQSM